MSGMYKWSEVSIDPTAAVHDVTTGCFMLAAVVAARAAAAAAEATIRLEAEETVLNAELVVAKDKSRCAAKEVGGLLEARAPEVAEHDLTRLNERLASANANVEAARNFTQLEDAILEADRVRIEFEQAAVRKKTADARAGRTEAVALMRLRFDDLKKQIAEMDADPVSAEVGAEDAPTIKSLMASAGGALQTANEAMIEAKVGDLDTAVQQRSEAVLQARERRQRRAALGAQAVTEGKMIVAGLEADAVVLRWHARAVADLKEMLVRVAAMAEANADPEGAIRLVQGARERAITIVTEANAAQIKADQRDYIAQSIGKSLEEMGFVVGPPQAEHPDHPATATVLHAATAGGKNISVSVPVDGQVWYNVQGFPKSSEAKVGGGDAAICDEAEAVIEEMHDALQEQFKIQMGELMWDGKDPERRLRAVQSLPKSETRERTVSRP